MKIRLMVIVVAALVCQGCWFSIIGGDFGLIYKGAVEGCGPGAEWQPQSACDADGPASGRLGASEDPSDPSADFS